VDPNPSSTSLGHDVTVDESGPVRPPVGEPTIGVGPAPDDEPRLADLLSVWQANQDQGEDLPAAELCRDCPELAPELERRLRALRQVNRLARRLDSKACTAPTLGSDEPAPVQIPAGVAVPGYDVVGVLGRGGMGVVYQARQKGLNRLVALKMILAGAHASVAQLARFRAEAEAVASLQHPNIVQVYEIGEQDGRSYFSLEYVDGGSLAQKLNGSPQQPRYAAALVQALARAVHYAHERGIVHRDLKPANVLLTSQGTPKVTDFGLARRLDEDSQTRTGDVMGTPSYMAPEQAAGKVHEIGPPADIYALGALLYEALTGRPPFRGATLLETLEQVRGTEPVPPRRLQPSVPRDLETICLKCLEKEPKKRYPSADALANDLRRFLAGEPIQARPATAWERGWKWARRRPAIAALSAALVLVFVVGFLGITWKWLEAERLGAAESEQRRKAEAAQQAADRNAANERTARLRAEKAETEAREQEKQARSAEAAARAEALRRQSVSDFLLNLFKSADPVGLQGYGFRAGHERGAGLTALELLNRGADRVAVDLKGQPELQAMTLDTLGNTFRELGDFDRAEQLLKRALSLREQALPKDHPDLASSLHNLGWVYHDRGDYRQGLKYYERAYALRKRLLGPENPATVTSMFNLAWLLAQIGDYPRSEELFSAVIVLRRKQHGHDNHRDVAVAQIGLAALWLETGQGPKALGLVNQAIKTLTALEGDKSITIAVTKFQQGVVAQQFNNHAAAVRHLSDCLTIARRILGDGHPYIAVIQTQRADSLHPLGKLQEAEEAYREALAVTRKSVGMIHPKALVLVERAAELLARRNKRAEAQGLFDELLKARRERLGKGDVFVAEGLTSYARFLQRAGDRSRAEDHYREAVAIFSKTEVHRVAPQAEAVAGLGALLRQSGRLAEAEGLLRQAVVLQAKLVRMDPQVSLDLRNQLISVLLEQHKLAAAKPYLAELLALHRARKTEGVTLLVELARAGRVHCALGQIAEAEKHFREALTRARTLFAVTPAKIVPHEEDLAWALLEKGDRKEALAGFTRAAAVRQGRPFADPTDFAATLRRLALAQRAAGDEDGCRQTAARLRDMLADTKDEHATALLLRTCTLAPGAPRDPGGLIALAEQLVERNPSPTNLAALGAVLCRAGRLDEAVSRLEEAHRADARKIAPQAALFLSLACQRLHQTERARQWLQTASKRMAPSAPRRLRWEDRLEQQVLLREAQALLK
jgi:tetratricopeptide (TPR) repeat protein